MDDAKLRVVGGTKQGEEFALQLPVTIGRGRDNSITLGESLVSRRHCRISLKDDLLVVSDLDSLNGTYVGSERIAGETKLDPGQLLTVGTVTFRAIYGDCEKDESDIGTPELANEENSDVLGEDTVNLGEGGTAIDPTSTPDSHRIDASHEVPAPKARSTKDSNSQSPIDCGDSASG